MREAKTRAAYANAPDDPGCAQHAILAYRMAGEAGNKNHFRLFRDRAASRLSKR
jgi:hypothetical protein